MTSEAGALLLLLPIVLSYLYVSVTLNVDVDMGGEAKGNNDDILLL